jgi:hypothetical protein
MIFTEKKTVLNLKQQELSCTNLNEIKVSYDT